LINYEITYDAVMKSSGVGGFDLLKIFATALKIRVKMVPNFA